MNYKKFFIVGFLLLAVVIVSFVSSLWSKRGFSPLVSSQKIAPAARFESVAEYRGEAALSTAPNITEKKIIRTGSLTLVVESAEEAVKDIADIAEKQNGFVQSSYVSEDKEGSKRGSITVRVPSNIFFETIQAIKALAQIVEVEQTDTQDVAEQFIDLQARLKNLRATEAQYVELLKRSGSVKDILEVTRELSLVRGQIESLQGQIQYLERQSDMATITVSLSEVPTITLSLKNFQPLNAIKAAFRTLASTLISLFNLLVQFIIVVIPIAVIAGLLLLIAWRSLSRLKGRFFS
ncbi:MAG: DUF4349 domain-containing protein [Candidatus Portnoybacteria bacterium]|nr:DUF4349 domain-containing protein [Candidatus Portnoybacteria bacterium]